MLLGIFVKNKTIGVMLDIIIIYLLSQQKFLNRTNKKYVSYYYCLISVSIAFPSFFFFFDL